MFTYEFLQHYWWFIISLLGGLLVFLLFVQGGNSLIFTLSKDEEERALVVNSTGRKWEFTFTTLVTFGGAFFASFPLFYSTSFGGAYWVWMLILVTFVLQAVSYEFQSKTGRERDKRYFRYCLVANGILGPFLLGAAVSTFFEGSAFLVNKGAMDGTSLMPVISSWANAWHGLDVLANPWTYVLGFAVLFLSRILGGLYFLSNISEASLTGRIRGQILRDTVPFLLFFLCYVGHLLVKDGFAVNPETAEIFMQPYKYLQNLLAMPLILATFLIGVVGVLYGVLRSIFSKTFTKGIWTAGAGTVLTVLALFLTAGYNNTSYYPSTADLQSSLTLANSCSTHYTLGVMAVVSILVPFVLAYIFYAWRAIDSKQLTKEELKDSHHKY